MIEEYVLKKALDLAFTRVSDTLRRTRVKLSVSTDELETNLNHHLREVKNWSSEISFADLRSAKLTSDAYIPLDVFLHPRRHRISSDDIPELMPFEKLFDDESLRHVIILGQPGAGKTTSMKRLCERIFGDANFSERFSCPILIRLRDSNLRQKQEDPDARSKDDILIPKLQTLLGLRIQYPESLSSDEDLDQRRSIRDRVIIDILDSLSALIILDGFDEIAFKTHREAVVEELRTLANQLERSTLVLTSRTGEFNYHIENTTQFEISPLTDLQVASFASQWLGKEDGARLLSKLKDSPFADTAIRPLTIAHLCAIFERIGTIPDKPKTIYRKIVNLLLEEWDEQRSVKRESMYAGFAVDRKFEFLSHLAFVLTSSVRRSVFSKQNLVAAYDKIHDNFGLPRGEAAKVADELETHTGLFIQAGYELFEFSHKSLQEYLAAEFVVKLPSIPSDPRLITSIPNELAVATAISSSPSEYFAELVFERLRKMRIGLPFARAFVSRLLLENRISIAHLE